MAVSTQSRFSVFLFPPREARGQLFSMRVRIVIKKDFLHREHHCATPLDRYHGVPKRSRGVVRFFVKNDKKPFFIRDFGKTQFSKIVFVFVKIFVFFVLLSRDRARARVRARANLRTVSRFLEEKIKSEYFFAGKYFFAMALFRFQVLFFVLVVFFLGFFRFRIFLFFSFFSFVSGCVVVWSWFCGCRGFVVDETG